MSPGSIMPTYEWLFTSDLDTEYTTKKLEAMVSLGVPYSEEYVANAEMHLMAQAEEIAADLESQLDDVEVSPKEEIVALIAYLQRLGIDIKGNPSKHTEATVAGNVTAEK
jgi:cytochrome c oxidase cbb3-type subunit I/II